MTDEERIAEFERLNLLRDQLVKALVLPPTPIPLHRRGRKSLSRHPKGMLIAHGLDKAFLE